MEFNMETIKDLLLTLLQAVIIGSLPVIAKFIKDFLSAKSAQLTDISKNDNLDAVIARVFNLADRVVTYVSQTYVDAIKADGKFDPDEHAEAFNMAYERLLSMIDEESKGLLESTFGDLATYLQTIIEAAVRDGKRVDTQDGIAPKTLATVG